jgi:type I restriction enzyme S subunit
MSEWRTICLNDAVSKLGDGLHGTPEYDENGEYYFINGNNLVDGEIVFKDARRVSITEYNKHKKELTDRTIMVSINGTLGNVAVYKGEKCILGKSACYFNVHEDYDKGFIRYIVSTGDFKDYIRKFANGTTIKNVSLKVMRDYPFDCPDLLTQCAIAATFSALDDKIANNRAINNHLEQMAQAIFKSWFVDLEPFGGVMPEDWREGTLSDIANVTMGQSPDGKSYNENGIGTVFYQGRAEFGSRFPTRRLFTTGPNRMAAKGDVLMSVRAPVGDLNVAFESCCIGRGLVAVQSRSAAQSFTLYTMFALKQILDMFNGEGTVFGSINKNDMANLPVLIPTDEAIRQFEELVHPMDTAIEVNYAENCHLQAVRDSLLPRLMSGELSVVDIGDTK